MNYAANKRMVELQLETYHNGIWSNVTTSTDLDATYNFVYDESKLAVVEIDGTTYADADAAIAGIQGELAAGTGVTTNVIHSGSPYASNVIVVAVGNATSSTLTVKKAGETAKASYTFNVANTVPTLQDINLQRKNLLLTLVLL